MTSLFVPMHKMLRVYDVHLNATRESTFTTYCSLHNTRYVLRLSPDFKNPPEPGHRWAISTLAFTWTQLSMHHCLLWEFCSMPRPSSLYLYNELQPPGIPLVTFKIRFQVTLSRRNFLLKKKKKKTKTDKVLFNSHRQFHACRYIASSKRPWQSIHTGCTKTPFSSVHTHTHTRHTLHKQTRPLQHSIVWIKGPLWLFAFLMVS